ncbi:MAG: chemotaxis protein CheB, partial [Ktedonobacterales bacterium]
MRRAGNCCGLASFRARSATSMGVWTAWLTDSIIVTLTMFVPISDTLWARHGLAARPAGSLDSSAASPLAPATDARECRRAHSTTGGAHAMTNDTASTQLVVVGSSAGGIEALQTFVSTLPRDFPAPIVIAQHLDPKRPSHLGEILE